jgi:hypothetical protein
MDGVMGPVEGDAPEIAAAWAAAHLIAVVLDEQPALEEILTQLLTGSRGAALGDDRTRNYFNDLAVSVERIVAAAREVGAEDGRVAAEPLPPVG